MLGMVDGHDLTCANIKQITDTQLNEISEKISDLKKLEKTLKDISSACSGSKTPDCPIIESLFS